MVQTPANITLPKSKHNVAVSCTAQCYSPGVSTLASHTEVMTAGDVVFGGLIGLGIDAASGAMNTYDPNVERQSTEGKRADGRARLKGHLRDIAFRSNEGSAKRAGHSGRAL
jgi:hypothetical protein